MIDYNSPLYLRYDKEEEINKFLTEETILIKNSEHLLNVEIDLINFYPLLNLYKNIIFKNMVEKGFITYKLLEKISKENNIEERLNTNINDCIFYSTRVFKEVCELLNKNCYIIFDNHNELINKRLINDMLRVHFVVGSNKKILFNIASNKYFEDLKRKDVLTYCDNEIIMRSHEYHYHDLKIILEKKKLK